MAFLKNYSNTFFLTATILEWKHLLKPDKYKAIIVSTLKFLVENERIKLYGFVVMPNHLHLIWRELEGFTKNQIQGSLLRFTAQKIKYDLVANHPAVLEKFLVSAKDREYQIWERNPLAIQIYTAVTMQQKLDYIHKNPVQAKWNLAETPSAYCYSSIRFYTEGIDDFGILTNPFAE